MVKIACSKPGSGRGSWGCPRRPQLGHSSLRRQRLCNTSGQPHPVLDHSHSTKVLHERCSSLLIVKELFGAQVKSVTCFLKHKMSFCLKENRSGSNYDFSFPKSCAFNLERDPSCKIIIRKRKEHRIIVKLIGLSFSSPSCPLYYSCSHTKKTTS